MAHLFQVGAGSGGMTVLDLVCRDPRIDRVTLIEPDIFKPHNAERHFFGKSAVGEPKAVLAERWLKEIRPALSVTTLICNLLDPVWQPLIEQAAATCDLGVCAADNEPAKYHFDALMRRFAKPWTLGEVLSGGIGGFVHWYRPGSADLPCYGCVASHLQRAVVTEQSTAPPDYANPGGPVQETTIPASKASIQTMASLHALVTLGLLAEPASYQPGFTTLLLSLQQVPGVFEDAFRPYRFRIARSPDCLICQTAAPRADAASCADGSAEDLDVAVDQALARLGNV